MFSGIANVISNGMAIDLGTANTLVYVPGRGIVLDEPSIVAISHEGGERKVHAVGHEAKKMLGRTPEHIETIRPMRDGVIADFNAAEDMIKYFIRKIHKRRTITSPTIMVCIPAGATPVERRAVQEAAIKAGARKVYLIEEPVAAALGANLTLSQPHGVMVVDIGGGTTDIAVMSLGGVLYSRSLRAAGNTLDEAIISYLRNKHNLLIGEATAETIKVDAGAAIAKANGHTVEIHVKGRDLRRGVPGQIKLEPADIAEALEPPLAMIADGVKQALAEIPPELAADIFDDGICLTGGGALLDKIAVKLARATGVKYKIPEDPLRCVVIGTGYALEKEKEIKDLLASVN